MSSSSTPAAELKHQYDALSHEAVSLSSVLARRRADIALKRAEAATIAVSLEAAKDDLDSLLRDESAIRSSAPLSPRQSSTRADFFPDPGLVRALSGQLEVTQDWLRSAYDRRSKLREQLKSLQNSEPRAENSSSSEQIGGSASAPAQSTQISSSNDESYLGSQPSRGAERALLATLKQDSETESTFRQDHARIWRDVTMPNLALIPHDPAPSSSEQVSLGVVIERIFEGVTCFAPTATKSGTQDKELRIESSESVEKSSENDIELVIPHFAALKTRVKEEDYDVRVIAPKVALSKVIEMVSDNEIAKRIPSSPRPMPLASTSSSGEEVDGPLHDVDVTAHKEERVQAEKHQEAVSKVAQRLSHSSHVLTPEHIIDIFSLGVPTRFRESSLELVYSTNLHGISLHTLYHRAKKRSPTIIVIRDTQGNVFGCYGSQAWKATATRYYGSGESFVFGAEDDKKMKIFKWSRANSYFQFTSNTFLAIGGGAGSHFALWLDEDLLMGTTAGCATFNSPPLTLTTASADEEKNTTEFKIVSLEVWAFVPRRIYSI
eukprot:TRINITY_DN412_c2_g1_i1.p1 TRINITY_DN412_c2_g1~~TRINITY_DN412_c2_g1_i1.p1  ORF type:complete len:549 (+),score=71.39 TRINITY_DN412_c2_g1_i1:1182-2828(+)